ncbi:MAG: alcohol dehydrogenase catalytic domain-containing protein [bacterium]
MRTAVYYHNADVRLEERPVPSIGPGEALVRVETSGICGSDVMEWYRRARAPLILGHEIAGSVVDVATGVERLKVGTRVTAAHHVPCNSCRHCLRGHHTLCATLHRTNFDPGGFAEYIRLLPIHIERGVFPLPDTVSFEEAVFVEPLACVLRGQQIARVRPADTVLVIGSGIAGLLHIKLALTTGAGRIAAVDVKESRLRFARRVGAEVAIPAADDVPKAMRAANNGRLADVVILCTGAGPAFVQALRSVEPGGTILLFAPAAPDFTLQVPVNDVFWRTDVTITTSYGASPGDYAAALELIHLKRVPVLDMITHRLGLSEAAEGFGLVAAAGESVKVVLDHRR